MRSILKKTIIKMHIYHKISMFKVTTAFIVLFLLWNICEAQTLGNKQPNASIDFIINNSPAQTLVMRSINADMKYEAIDSARLGERGGRDSVHFEIYVDGRESHLSPRYSKKKLSIVPILTPGDHLIISADFNHPENIKITGSPRTLEFYNFFSHYMNIGEGHYLQYAISLKNGSGDSTSLKFKIDSIKNIQSTYLRNEIFHTNCAYIVVVALMNSQNNITYSKSEIVALREKFKDDMPVLMQLNINENLQDHPRDTKPKPSNGTLLANFSLPDLSGKQISLNQFRGKYVLVDFWASWCIPCKKELPYLKRAAEKYGSKNLTILSVSIDENHDSWKKAIIQDNTGMFTHLIDDRGRMSPVTKQYHVQSIPSNFLIDPSGKIIDQDLRGDKLTSRLSEIFNITSTAN